MTTQQKLKEYLLTKTLAGWPATAPAGMEKMPKTLARKCLLEVAKAEEMPDAELTPEIVALRQASRIMFAQALDAWTGMGRALLEIRAGTTEKEFWRLLKREMPSIPREEAELGMELAREGSK